MKSRFQPIIRVFVSSTFSDLKEERNCLQRDVFPELERFCLDRQFQFQAIDLRWGVPGEAGLDHRTMRICFDELRRAQDVSPRPNFLVLLGNRYGWRPLPEEITEAEFQSLAAAAAALNRLNTLRTWYRRDDNAVPPVYVLRSRRDTPEGDSNDYTLVPVWNAVQGVLWAIINRAYPPNQLASRFQHIAAGEAALPALVKFQTSATEQEIWRGALTVADASEHVVAWFREIQNRDEFQGDSRANDFFDIDSQGRFDSLQRAALEQLKDALTANLCRGGRAVPPRAAVQLRPTADGSRLEVTPDHLKPMGAEILRRIQEVIGQQIDEYWRPTATHRAAEALPQHPAGPNAARQLELEQLAHESFGEARAPAEQFVGRAAELAQIAACLTDPSERGPLVVHGPSGVGKTAVLARAAQQARAAGWKPLVRFLGTTPQSSDLRGLLTNLCCELRERHPIETALPTDLRELQDELYTHLAAATPAEPIFLFLDALDQLDEADDGRQLLWLRLPLPPHVKLVVSCVSGVAEHNPLGEPFRALQRRELLGRTVELTSLHPEKALALLQRWLECSLPRRALTDAQRAAVAARVGAASGAECRRPLYLRILFEECRLWPSYQPVAEAPISCDTGKLLRNLLLRLASPALHGPTVERALSYLAAARRGLTENELLEILWDDPDYQGHLRRQNEATRHEFPAGARRIPIALWARLRHDLAAFLMEHSAPGGSVLNFYHRQVAGAVEELFLTTPDRLCLYHGRLANYFARRDWWREPRTAQGRRMQPPYSPRPADVRKADELPWQLNSLAHTAAAAGLDGERDHALQRIEDLFTTLDFLEAKTESGRVGDLVSDFAAALQTLPAGRLRREIIGRLDEALRRHLPFVTRHAQDFPQALFQCLWNRCWWLDSAELPTGGQLAELLERWLQARQQVCADFLWVRSCRPPVAANPVQRLVLSGHSDQGSAVWWSPEGNPFACAHAGKGLGLWNVETGNQVLAITDERYSEEQGFQATPIVAFSPDGRRLAVLITEQVRVWDAASGAAVACLTGATFLRFSRLAFSPDARRLAASGGVATWVWDIETSTLLAEIEGDPVPVTSIAFTPDGRLCTASMGGHVRFYHAVHLKKVGSFSPQVEGINTQPFTWGEGGQGMTATLSADARLVAVELGHQLAYATRVWDLATGAELPQLQENDNIRILGFSPDRRLIAGQHWMGAQSGDNLIRVWDVSTGKELRRLAGHGGYTFDAQFSPDGKSLLSSAEDRTVRVWDLESPPQTESFFEEGHTRPINDIAMSPDGRYLATGAEDAAVCLWEASTGRLLRRIERQLPVQLTVRSVAFSLDGSCLAVGGIAGIWVAGIPEGALLYYLSENLATEAVAWHPGGQALIVATGSLVRLLRVPDGQEIASLDSKDENKEVIQSVACSRDGRFVAAGGNDGTIRLWDLSSRKFRMVGKHRGPIQGLAFREGKLLAQSFFVTISRHLVQVRPEQQMLRIWDPGTGTCESELAGRTDVRSLALLASRGWWARVEKLDTALVSAGLNEVHAWYPAVDRLAAFPDGRTWAASVGPHLQLFTLQQGALTADQLHELRQTKSAFHRRQTLDAEGDALLERLRARVRELGGGGPSWEEMTRRFGSQRGPQFIRIDDAGHARGTGPELGGELGEFAIPPLPDLPPTTWESDAYDLPPEPVRDTSGILARVREKMQTLRRQQESQPTAPKGRVLTAGSPLFPIGSELSPKALESGEPFYQIIETTSLQVTTIAGSPQAQDQKQTYYYCWTPRGKKRGKYTVVQKVLGLKMTLEGSGFATAYDSTIQQRPSDSTGEFLQQLVGAELTLTIARAEDGCYVVEGVQGVKELVDKLARSNPSQLPLLQSLLSEDSIKQTAEQWLHPIPPYGVLPKNGSWTRTSTLAQGPLGTYVTTEHYSVAGMSPDNRLLWLNVQTDREHLRPAESEPGLLPFQIKASQLRSSDSGGMVEFHVDKGRVESSRLIAWLEGSMVIDSGSGGSRVELEQVCETSLQTLDCNPLPGPCEKVTEPPANEVALRQMTGHRIHSTLERKRFAGDTSSEELARELLGRWELGTTESFPARSAPLPSSPRDVSRAQAAPSIRERALQLIRDNQPERAVDLLLPLLYRAGRIPMVENADVRDVAACAAAAIRAGMFERVEMLAKESAGGTREVCALIRQVLADWKRTLTWKEWVLFTILGWLPAEKTPDVARLLEAAE